MNIKKLILDGRAYFLATLFSLFLFSFSSHAQRQTGDLGVGFQVGQPTGISLKFYKENGMGLDFLAAWDLDDFFFVNVHGNWEKHLDKNEKFHIYYGPGAFIGFRDKSLVENKREDQLALGISAQLGFNYVFSPSNFEIFIQGTPRFQLIDNTQFDMGGGAGLRFYF